MVSRKSLSLSLQRMCIKEKGFFGFFFLHLGKKTPSKIHLFFYSINPKPFFFISTRGKKRHLKKHRAFFTPPPTINTKESETKRDRRTWWTRTHTQLLGLVQKVVVVACRFLEFSLLFSLFSLFCCCCCCSGGKGVCALVRNNSTFSFPCVN